MELDFVKLHGLGNDFVFIDDFSRDVELTQQQVLCFAIVILVSAQTG